MAIPSTTIYLCRGVRLNNKYEHTYHFNSIGEQQSFFDGKVVKQLSNYVYQRKSWDMRVRASMAEAKEWSYLFFTNPGEWRRSYYFITDIEYENDNTVILKLELDVMQTYFQRYQLRPCFVEREHAADDTLGANTVEESLEIGDYVSHWTSSTSYTSWCVLILTSVALDKSTDNFPATYGSTFNGNYSALAVYAVDMSESSFIADVLIELSKAGKSDAILSMWMYPKDLLTLKEGQTWSEGVMFKQLADCEMHKWELMNSSFVDGYIPKNNKVRQYPYNFIYITNNNGGAAVYKYEYFGDPNDIAFNTFGVISPEAIACLYPLNYKGTSHNYDEKLTLTGFPTCAWSSDTYKLWLAQTQNQRDTAMVLNGLTVAGGAATTIAGLATQQYWLAAGGVGTMISGGSAIAESLAQKADKSIAPPQAHGSQSGGLNMVAGDQEFTFYRKSVDKYHAKMIDDYFTMYGYACKQVKTPNITSRERWNYVKTIGSNVLPVEWDEAELNQIESAICVNDLNTINRIFDNGITFWHDPENLGDYSLKNSIK